MGECGWPFGKLLAQKCAKRCHWCGTDVTPPERLPVVVAAAGATSVPTVQITPTFGLPAAVMSGEHPWPHIWPKPLYVRLLIDSLGKLKKVKEVRIIFPKSKHMSPLKVT